MGIEWTENLSVNVKEIDGQHKELIEEINNLLKACSQRRGQEQIGEMLDFLTEYVTLHFGTEERYMAIYGYPDAAAHKSAHDQFVKEILSFKANFAAEGVNINTVIQINHLVVDWLIKHICNVDKKLGTYLEGKVGKFQP